MLCQIDTAASFLIQKRAAIPLKWHKNKKGLDLGVKSDRFIIYWLN